MSAREKCPSGKTLPLMPQSMKIAVLVHAKAILPYIPSGNLSQSRPAEDRC